jgi:hypothetical protein
MLLAMGLTVADVMTALPAQIIVDLDDAGLPIRIGRGGRLFPVWAVAPDLAVAGLRLDPELERLLSQGLPGVLVLDGDAVVGCLTAADLVELGRPPTSRDYREGDSDDASLYAESRPVAHRVLVRCRTCGRTNSFAYLLPGDPALCAGGHLLDPDLS